MSSAAASASLLSPCTAIPQSEDNAFERERNALKQQVADLSKTVAELQQSFTQFSLNPTTANQIQTIANLQQRLAQFSLKPTHANQIQLRCMNCGKVAIVEANKVRFEFGLEKQPWKYSVFHCKEAKCEESRTVYTVDHYGRTRGTIMGTRMRHIDGKIPFCRGEADFYV